MLFSISNSNSKVEYAHTKGKRALMVHLSSPSASIIIRRRVLARFFSLLLVRRAATKTPMNEPFENESENEYDLHDETHYEVEDM